MSITNKIQYYRKYFKSNENAFRVKGEETNFQQSFSKKKKRNI